MFCRSLKFFGIRFFILCLYVYIFTNINFIKKLRNNRIKYEAEIY